MKRINSKYLNDAQLTECVNSAYTDLQVLLQDAFSNISKLQNQLTLTELYTLFESYDWNDLFNKLEEIENCTDLINIESVYSILTEYLKSDNNIKPLTNPRENTYYKVWAGLMAEDDF